MSMTFESLKSEREQLISKCLKLASEVGQLKAEHDELLERVRSRDRYNEQLEEMLRLLRYRHFASSSEKFVSEDLQLLFNEIEVEAKNNPEPADEGEQQELIEVSAHKKKKPKRKSLPKDLPRVEVIIDLPEDQRKCPHDGTELKVIGEQTSERLDVIPMQMKVIVTKRLTHACPCCETHIKTAPVEPHIVPKGVATAGTLAFIATSKFCDGLSLYHIEEMFKRHGIDGFTRGSQANWMVRASLACQPLINLLEEDLLSGDYIQMDETTIQVLKEEGKKPQTKSYMWLRARPVERPMVLFDYDATRSGRVAVQLMLEFKGRLQCDGYCGYDELEKRPHIIRHGCFAHSRRKFHEAIKSVKDAHIAKHALKLIQKLYKVEDECEGKTPDDVVRIREEKAKPLLNELEAWKDKNLHRVPPKSQTGKALSYLHNEWPYLVRYLEDGRVKIDNNFIENKIRPFAIGRKRWLFSDTVEGAQASAILYSLVETAKANGIEPYWYLRKVFEDIPKAQTVDDFERLLPWNMKKENLQPLRLDTLAVEH